jgi:hypothetical protein
MFASVGVSNAIFHLWTTKNTLKFGSNFKLVLCVFSDANICEEGDAGCDRHLATSDGQERVVRVDHARTSAFTPA